MLHLRSAALAALAAVLTAPVGAQDVDGLPLPSRRSAADVPARMRGPAVDTVRRFYDAFARSDFATLESIYAPDVMWNDRILSAGSREELMDIWRLELDPEAGGRIEYEIRDASVPDRNGSSAVRVVWRDRYRFLGQPIDTTIDATLLVDRHGRIREHRESYSWSRWAHQAFPYLGGLVDRPLVRNAMKFAIRQVVRAKVAVQRHRAARTEPEAPRSPGFVRRLER